jgi:hypothetical protein
MTRAIDTNDYGDGLVVHEDKTTLAVMAVNEHAHGLE